MPICDSVAGLLIIHVSTMPVITGYPQTLLSVSKFESLFAAIHSEYINKKKNKSNKI